MVIIWRGGTVNALPFSPFPPLACAAVKLGMNDARKRKYWVMFKFVAMTASA